MTALPPVASNILVSYSTDLITVVRMCLPKQEPQETQVRSLGLGRSPGGEHGNPLQYSCLVNPHGQRSLACYSPWGCKELDMTEQHSTSTKCNLTDLTDVEYKVSVITQ